MQSLSVMMQKISVGCLSKLQITVSQYQAHLPLFKSHPCFSERKICSECNTSCHWDCSGSLRVFALTETEGFFSFVVRGAHWWRHFSALLLPTAGQYVACLSLVFLCVLPLHQM